MAQRILLGLFSIALPLACTDVHAAPILYFGQDNPRGSLESSTAAFDAFVATLSSYGVDTLEDYPGFSVDPVLSFGSTGLTAESDFNFVAAFATFAVGGNNTLYDAGPGCPTGDSIDDSFTFSAPITAFGAFISNAGDGAENSISIVLQNTLLGTSKKVEIGAMGPNLISNNAFFVGITDLDPFDRVLLVESYDYDGLLLDNITAGYVAVPEASSLALLGLAIGGFTAYRWRRSRRQPSK